MEFCPKCGAMMLPIGGVLKCNTCGYSDELENNNSYEVSEEFRTIDNVKFYGEHIPMPQYDIGMYKRRRFQRK